MRPARILAIALRDLRIVHAGKGWYRLPLLALGLLLPAGGLPLRLEAPARERVATVSGEVPEQLQGQLQVTPDARVRLAGVDPVVVQAAAIPDALRAALDTLPGPQVTLTEAAPSRRLPGRSLIVALLAISLLTGPLSESLPGERSGRTLEVLLSAAVRRSELTLGKWLCWTGYGGGLALLAALGGILSGAQAPGLWPLALPIVVGTATALGFWLVRGAADEVAGAGVPMRVLPAAALGLGGLAWLISGAHPHLAAALPMGGALLVASGVLQGWGALALSALGSGLWIAGLLWAVSAALDQGGAQRPDRLRALGPALLAPPLCWLPLAGPGLWAVAGNPNMALPEGAGRIAAGGMCAAMGLVLIARDGRWPMGAGSLRGAGLGLGLGAAVGLLLAGLAPLGLVIPTAPWFAPLATRLLEAPLAAGPAALLLWALGASLLFFAALPARVGWPAAVLIYTLAATPLSPLDGLLLGSALAWAAHRWGLLPAVCAQIAALVVVAQRLL